MLPFSHTNFRMTSGTVLVQILLLLTISGAAGVIAAMLGGDRANESVRSEWDSQGLESSMSNTPPIRSFEDTLDG